MLLVVCGSRDWPEDKLWFVTSAMIDVVEEAGAGAVTVVTGGARGVDRHADMEAVRLRWATRVMTADWERFGRRAGIVRNCAMLDLRPSLVLAFHWAQSRGTAHMVREAYKRGIPFRRYTEESLRPDIAALDSDFEPIG